MAITPGAPLLPMWRSPTSSTCSSKTHALVGQDSWEDDGAKSPTRAVQCLNFLSQIEHIRIRETRKRVRDPVFEIDVFLSDDVGDDFAGSPTYQIERTLSELTQLRDQVIFWTKMQRESCSFCADFQKRSAAWGQHWPRSLLRRVFHSRQATEAPVQAMLEDVLQLARSGKNGTDRCAALQQVPALLTSFLVRQELFMDE